MKYFATSEFGDVVCLELRNGKTYTTNYMFESFPTSLRMRGYNQEQMVADFLFVPAPYITYDVYCRIHQIVPMVEKPEENNNSFEKFEDYLDNKYPFFTNKYGGKQGKRMFRIFREFLKNTNKNINTETELRFLYCCKLIIDKKVNKLNEDQPLTSPLSFVNSADFIKHLYEAFE